jgi:hypothetical protein
VFEQLEELMGYTRRAAASKYATDKDYQVSSELGS